MTDKYHSREQWIVAFVQYSSARYKLTDATEGLSQD